MTRFYRTPLIIRKWYPSLIWKIPSKNKIYLTFDDGPDPEVTPWILNELKTVNAKATFFCVGKNLMKHPKMADQIISCGHQIGNHTFHHLMGWKTNDDVYIEDVGRCDRLLQDESDKHNIFRPPYGRITRRQIRMLSNYKLIMWSHLSWDFDSNLDVGKSIQHMIKAKPGSILVFHDSQKAFKNLKILLPKILTHFCLKGVQFDKIQ